MTEARGTSGSDLPPVPDSRCISPAVEDYASRPALASLLWPVGWLGAFALLAFLLTSYGWHEEVVPHKDTPGHDTPGHGSTEAPGHSESR